MISSALNGLLLLLFALAAAAGTPEQAMVRYPDLPLGARPQVLAADTAGNLFIVSNVVDPSGRPQIHVLKTDSQGNTIASLEFGGTSVGAGVEDNIRGAAVDPSGSLVIAGTTYSSDFPLVSPLAADTTEASAFVTKIDSQLKGILFSTKLAGTQGGPFAMYGEGGTSAGGLAVDKSGNIFVAGSTTDTDFPTTPGAFQTKPPQSNKSGTARYAFVTEISFDSRKIVFSTYFGDSAASCTGSASLCAGEFGSTYESSIAVDSAGNVVIAGTTTANQLPVTSGVFGPSCGACASYPQADAGFVAKIAAGGSKLLWATYVPVVSAAPYFADIVIAAIALDSSGNVIAGGQASNGLPVTAGALQTVFPVSTSPGFASFVMKLDSAGQRLLFSTYFGGETIGPALVLDTQGTIWVTGTSPTDELPVPKGTPVLGGCYLAGLSADGSSLASILTAPTGAVGQALALTSGSVTAMGASGTLLTASPGQGSSLVGIGNAAALSVSVAVAPYELVSLYGLGLGPQTPAGAQVVNGLITSSLGGVQVLFDGTPAPLLFVGPAQINTIVPSGVYGQDKTTIEIVTPTGTLKGPTIPVLPSQPAVFLASTTPPGFFAPYAAALNQDGSVNSAENPAAFGSIVTVWVSGAGISSYPLQDGAILPLLQSVHSGPTLFVSMFSFELLSAVAIGGFLPGPLSLEVLYAGDAAGMVAGVTQINFRLPALPAQTGSFFGNVNNFGFAIQIGNATSGTFTVYLDPRSSATGVS